MRRIILVLVVMGIAFMLCSCNGVPEKIQVAIEGNLKTATEFQKFYTDLINCENQADLDKLWKWAVENCPEKCPDVETEKGHKKARLASNIVRAQRLSKWAKDEEKED